ncbi:HAMP domain-containing histidine kinase [Ralstonia sp. CHL-2022]|uniref:histidine kinase n=1 Tax=Ralstonia mojiangensis TaxID=2953895 RepID=A0ABT2LBC7_9RALS|nr:sensor histidine kinase [Ralstonia mojiangensis]MCT7311964.1 HAMP domain-containing histidine kinase [Ralstonia mojiangensis]
MNLSEFIEANLPSLIGDWTEYARKLDSGRSRLSDQQLRNSARDLLLRIAADMREGQTPAQQRAKSEGDRAPSGSGFNEAAHEHADDRLSHGFDINDLVAEYRVLRASVLRRWQQDPQSHTLALQEMVRFNEAIDQMLAESVRQHAQQTERTRDLFAGVLAHDLRSPLGAILASAETLLHDDGLSSRSVRAVAFIQRGAMRVQKMIDDLLVFTRTRLGDFLPTRFSTQDMGRLCSDAIDEVCASYPDAQIDLRLAGDLRGTWDGSQLGQLLVNLLTNAVRYGTGRVAVEAAGRDGQMTVAVSNAGNPIPPAAFPTLFDPLTRAARPDQSGSAAGIGLGLYICRCIVQAHRGTIDVRSSEHGTTFTVRIPYSGAA